MSFSWAVEVISVLAAIFAVIQGKIIEVVHQASCGVVKTAADCAVCYLYIHILEDEVKIVPSVISW